MRIPLIGLFAVLSLGLASISLEAQARMYECVRPDGTTVCTVNTELSDPSVACNHECVDCNMVCTAQARVIRDDGQTMTSPAEPMPGRRSQQEAPNTRETPEFCRQQYESCAAACRSNPSNRSAYDLDACVSSCRDTMTGCGRRPSGGM